jgi:hypothetical protein
METIVHIALTPDETAKLTPLELLEDFADASPDWHYLEEESNHYAEVKDVPACVLRHRRDGTPPYVDFGFASADPGHLTDIELVILDAPDPEHSLELEERNAVVDAFLQEMRDYLNARPGHATLRVEKDDVPQEKAKKAT